MGFPKPLLTIGAETYLARIAAAMLTAVDRLVIVLGAHATRIRPAVPADPRITVVENPDFARGQLSSLKCGLAALGPDAQAVIVHLVDHPKVAVETFRAARDAFAKAGNPILIARYRGRRGHPVVFARTLFAELGAAPEEQGAKVVVNADPGRVTYFDVDDAGVIIDLDTPEDVAQIGLSTPVKSDHE